MGQQIQQGISLERRPANQYLVKNIAQGINIGGAADLVDLACGLLWGHVSRGTYVGPILFILQLAPIKQLGQLEATDLGDAERIQEDDPRFQVLDMPLDYGEVRLVDGPFLEATNRLDRWVNVWTIDDPETMRSLAAVGVGGIMTDRPDLLREVLG